MTPFQVQCETCKTSLRVREPGFIGQVHACPHCGSMVFITPPNAPSSEDATTEVHSAHATPPAANEPTYLALGDTLVEAPDSQPPTSNQEEQLVTSEKGDQDDYEQTTTELASLEPEVARLVIPGGAAIWTTAVSLALTVGLVVYTTATGSSKEEVSQSTAAQPLELPSETTEPVADPKSDSEETMQVIEATEADDPPKVKTSELSEEDFTLPDPPSELASDQPEPPETELSPATDSVTTKPMEVESLDPTIQYTNLPKSADPLDYDPTDFDMALIGASETSAPNETISHTTNRPVSEAETIAILPRENNRKQASKVSIVERNPLTLNAEESLANPLPEVDLKQVPLADALALFTNLTGIPISTNPAALRYAAIDANQKIDINGVGIPVADILSKALSSARLSLVIEGQFGRVVRDSVESESTVTHTLSDLEPLTEDHLRLFQAYSDMTIKLDGLGNLPITQPKRQQFDLLILTERIRLARGLSTTSKYPKRLLSIEPLYAQLASVLERKTTFNFVSATRFGALVDHLSQATGLTVLVDWPALAEVGISPNTTLTALADNCTWNEALDGLLGQLQLSWAPLDGKTLWISSKSADQARHFTEFYPGMPKQKAKTLVESFAEAVVIYDEPSRTTIVHGNSTTQRAAYQLWLSQ